MHRKSYQGCDPSFSRTAWGHPHTGISPLNRPENLGPSRGVSPLNRPAHLAHPSRGLSPLNRPDNWTPSKENQGHEYGNLTPLIRPQDVPLPVQPEPRRERSRNWTTTKRRLQLTPQKQERIKAWYEEYERDSRLSHSNDTKQRSVHLSPSILDSSEKHQQKVVKRRRYKNPRRRRAARRNITRLRVEEQAGDECTAHAASQIPTTHPALREDTGLTATVSVPKLIPTDVALPDSDSSSDSDSCSSSCCSCSSSCSCSCSCSSSDSDSESDKESEDEAEVSKVAARSGNMEQSSFTEQITTSQDKMIINKPESTPVMAKNHLSLPRAIPRPSFREKKPVSSFEDDLIFGQMDLLTKAPHDIEATTNPADVSLGTFPLSGTSSLAASGPSHIYTESMIFDIRHKPQKRALLPWYDEDKLNTDPEVVLPPPPSHPIFPYCFVDINGFLSPFMARLSLRELSIMHTGGGDAPQSSGSGATNARKRGVDDAMETDEARRTSDKMADDNKRQKLELLDKAEKKQKEMRSILEDIKVKVTTRTQQLQQWAKKRRQQLRRWGESQATSSSSSCKKHQLARKAADDSEPCKKSKYCWEKN